jgi:hypothetical protein
MFKVFIRRFVRGEISHLFIHFLVKVLKNKKPDDGLCQAETCYLHKYFYFILFVIIVCVCITVKYVLDLNSPTARNLKCFSLLEM